MSDERENRITWEELLNKTDAPSLSGSWKAMEGLLDRDMPAAPRRRGWPWLLLLLLLLVGVCNYYRGSAPFHETSQKPQGGRTPVAGAPIAGAPHTAAPAEGAPVAETPHTAAPGTQNRGGATASTDRAAPASGLETNPDGRSQTTSGATRIAAAGTSTINADNAGTTLASDVNTGKATGNPATASATNGSPTTGTINGSPAASASDASTTNGSPTAGTTNGSPAASASQASTTNGSPAAASTTLAGTSTKGKAAAKPSDTTAIKKRAAVNMGKKEPWPPYKGFTVGIGLNKFFPVGQQANANFNSSGNDGTITDYLPVPEVRYFFSKRLYVQAEAQFNAPQYTSKNLLAGQQTAFNSANGSSVTTTTSVYIKKLFYFNLPISIHYAPIKNLYLGAGLEYARLTNGVANYQQHVSNGISLIDTVVYSKIQTFKGDSIYQKLRTNEWRLLGEANYQWRGFTLGLRYNWATDKFIHVQVSNTQVTQSRNTSLQLYLRYTIWRQRYPTKKKK